jgi:hypothetical protein
MAARFLFPGFRRGQNHHGQTGSSGRRMLTDEISYLVTRQDDRYFAVGTPFFGELARAGENLRAPVECLYLLAKGPENQNRACRRERRCRSAGCLGIFFFLRGTLSL